MMHVFLDSSVIISFCLSKTGASALILKYCSDKKIKGYISNKVVAEVRKNVLFKFEGKGLNHFEYILQENFLSIVPNPTAEQIDDCVKVINEKDAVILAAALNNSKISYLLTLDKKDFLKEKVVSFSAPLKITTPGEFVKKFRLSI